MFYDQLNKLCKENNTTPTAFITDKLGLSSSKITAWKGGGNSEIRNFTENIRIFQGSGKLSFFRR